MIKMLAISGSLRTHSTNSAILQAIVGLAADRVNISIYRGIGELPHFNPELDRDCQISSVRDWRNQLHKSDAVLFCTPEYAHGVPGALKNALDWIVSSGEFMHKPTAVISASPSPDGGDKANASLVQTLRVMMAEIVDGTTLCIPAVSAKFNDRDEVTDPTTERALRSLIDTLIATVGKQG
jgi:chromate reductase, NAD(P)H dehydrogenase (quinone)